MKTYEQLLVDAKSDKTRALRLQLDKEGLYFKIKTFLSIDSDALAALHLQRDKLGRNHFQRNLQRGSYSPDTLMQYLVTLEVPHFNVYDIENKDGLRIIELITRHSTIWDEDDQRGMLEIFSYILDRMTDINDLMGANGSTVAHAAIAEGNLGLLKLLVEKGADLQIQNFKGEDCDALAKIKDQTRDSEFYKSYIALRAYMELKHLPVTIKRKVGL